MRFSDARDAEMVTINLLPWREYERVYQLKEVKKCLAIVILLVMMVIILMHVIFSKREAEMRVSVAAKKEKLTHYYQSTDLNRVSHASSASVNSIMQLQNHHAFIRQLFVELGKSNVSEVCFTEIEHTNHSISFIGKARSATNLTEFLRHWTAASLFTEIRINTIEQQEDGLVRFGFQAVEKNNKKDLRKDF
jgi:Tfp pilus assembly protein PilN